MYEIAGSDRFYDIKNNAYWANIHLKSKLPADKCAAEDVADHINDCSKHPTQGMLAREWSKPDRYSSYYRRNKADYSRFDCVKCANDSFKSKYNELYPRTGSTRKKLIESGSIVLDTVKPIKKDFKRTLIKLYSKITRQY